MPSQSECRSERENRSQQEQEQISTHTKERERRKEHTHLASKQAHPYTRRDENALYQLDVDEGLFT